MLRRALPLAGILAVVVIALPWYLTAPRPLQAAALPSHTPDARNGELVFHVGGCVSCHAAPDAKGEDRLQLAGGRELRTDFGIFRVPNISPDVETGIGGWSTVEFVNALTRGISPDGEHYYPAFPYGSYARMRIEDAIDLKAFMDTLPQVSNKVDGHEIKFPFNVRRGLGIWKRLYVSDEPVLALGEAGEAVLRGQYLVEGPGHCGECHTSRDALGGLRKELWLAGAPNPEGRGVIPNITPHREGLGAWSEGDIATLLETGFTPDFDTLDGNMADVQEGLALLPLRDLEAIAAYLKAAPPLPDAVRRSKETPG